MSVSLAAIAAIGSAAASMYSAGKGIVANEEQRRLLRERYNEDDAEYGRLLNRSEVDNPENQSYFRKLKELDRERYNRARATNVVAGGTDAALSAMQAQNGQMVASAGDMIASRATATKDALRRERTANKRNYTAQMFGLEQQKAQQVAAAGAGASRAMAGIAAAAGSDPLASETTEESVPTYGDVANGIGKIDTTGAIDPNSPTVTNNTAQQLAGLEEWKRRLGIA